MSTDLHALEHAFAKDPSMDHCMALCEGYLDNRRHMEAMVVCKKGIKQNSSDPRGRTMLGRVYLDQGKLPKAEQEATAVLGAHPNHAGGWLLRAQIDLAQGKQAEAVTHAQKAWGLDPGNEAIKAQLAALGVAPEALGEAAAAATPAPAAAVPAPAGAMPDLAPRLGGPGSQAAVPAPSLVAAAAAAAAGEIPAPVASAETAPAPAAAEGGKHELEHVDDFFAPDTLGFSSDAGHIETAGPGRLTILGFVPKSTGSLKTTIAIALLAMVVGAGAIAHTVISSQNTRRIDGHFKKIRRFLEQDQYIAYKQALSEGKKILAIDDAHPLTLAAMAYVSGILAVEHGVLDALGEGEKYLTRYGNAAEKENGFSLAARALIFEGQDKASEGLTTLSPVFARGGANPRTELAGFRLRFRAKPQERETKANFRMLVSGAAGARVNNYLGWYHYRAGKWSLAEKRFAQALQSRKNHEAALLGKALTTLGAGRAVKEQKKDVTTQIKKVFAQIDEGGNKDAAGVEEVSPAIKAMAYFARSQLQAFEGEAAQAKKDYDKAVALMPKEVIFPLRRGDMLLDQSSSKMKAEALGLLQKAAVLAPNHALVHLALVRGYLENKQSDAALTSLEQAKKLGGDSKQIFRLKVDVLHRSGKTKDALKMLKGIAKDDTLYAFAQIEYGRLLRESGDKSRSVKVLERYLETEPSLTASESGALWCTLGQSYLAARNKKKALECMRVGIGENPDWAECHYHLCRALGRGQEAKAACKTYLSLEPRGPFAADARRRSR